MRAISIVPQLDRARYGRMLARIAPLALQTEHENQRLLAEIERLMAKGEYHLTPEEDAVLELLTRLVEAYESRVYPRKNASPAETVAFLLRQRGLSPIDLWPVLRSKGRVSEILSGKRGVSKQQAKALGAFFHVSPTAFL